MNADNAARFATFIGSLLRLDMGSSVVSVRRFRRVQVRVDTSQALKTGVFIRNDDGSHHWIAFKYERLSDFYFSCGKLGHVQASCSNSSPLLMGPRDPRQAFGIWMKVTASRLSGRDELKFQRPVVSDLSPQPVTPSSAPRVDPPPLCWREI